MLFLILNLPLLNERLETFLVLTFLFDFDFSCFLTFNKHQKIQDVPIEDGIGSEIMTSLL